MPQDIFISYSSSDRKRADSLADSLRSLGYSVWMDTSGIDAATSWSKEIAKALEDAKVVCVLISEDALASNNVAKEVGVAAELGKHFLPVELDQVKLRGEFLYHLANLQRVGHENLEGITRALIKLGISGAYSSGTDSPVGRTLSPPAETGGLRVRPTDVAISDMLRLAVLPFEDLSPSHDNDWFADGMMDELIGTLGSLSKLIVPGRSSVMVYKKDRPKASIIGQELEVRYIVEGTVRKAGEKIRISASLTDAKTNTQLWNNKFDGTFDDIFDFQERVAREITEGLKLKLTPQDEKKIEQKLTENPEAYELFNKGNTYFSRHTKQDFHYALDCFTEAIKLDPSFAYAYAHISHIHSTLYTAYEPDDSHIIAAKKAIEKARLLSPELPEVQWALSELHLRLGEKEEAILTAKKAIELDSKNSLYHFQLGFVYAALWQPIVSAGHYEDAIRLNPTNSSFHYNLCLQYDRLGDTERRNQAAKRGLLYIERDLKKNPDDLNMKTQFAFLLDYLGRREECSKIVDEFISSPHADGACIYNCACIIARQGEHNKALDALEKAVERGFSSIGHFRSDPDLDGLRGMPEFEELMRKLEAGTSEP